jgi:hypothetical protein
MKTAAALIVRKGLDEKSPGSFLPILGGIFDSTALIVLAFCLFSV